MANESAGSKELSVIPPKRKRGLPPGLSSQVKEDPFTYEVVLKFLNYIRQLVFLWSMKHALYHDVNKKTLAWHMMEEKLGIPAELLKWKWGRLDECYRTEKRIQKSVKSGDPGLTKTGKPRKVFEFFKAMEFLDQRRTPKSTFSNLEEFTLSDEFPTEVPVDASTEDSCDTSTEDSVDPLTNKRSVDPLTLKGLVDDSSVPIIDVDSLPIDLSYEHAFASENFDGSSSAANGSQTLRSGSDANNEKFDNSGNEKTEALSNEQNIPVKAPLPEQGLPVLSDMMKDEDIKISPWSKNHSNTQQAPTACPPSSMNNRKKRIDLSGRIVDLTETLISSLNSSNTKEVPAKSDDNDPDRAYCDLLYNEFKKMPSEKKNDIKKQLSLLLYA